MSPGERRVAVVGAGPAGFYAAGALLDGGPEELRVDLFDRLPTPWGLVRAGVAPDHPKIKSVSRVFDRTAAHPRFRFVGNVELGRDLGRVDLRRHYDAVVYAVGAQADRRLGIPGEDLRGSHPATRLVAWYNGHPDHADAAFDLGVERALVVGNGNVAIDVARILSMRPAELARTDIADHALAALRDSALEEVLVCGRRGAEHAAFTSPELAELRELDGVSLRIDAAEVGLRPGLDEDSLSSTARRNLQLMREHAAAPAASGERRLWLRFLRSPVEIRGEGRVEEVELAVNELLVGEDGRVEARATERRETISCGLVLRSVGYRGVALPEVPFDQAAGTIANEAGRVVGPDGAVEVGEYCVGWIRRGPSGVIGTNKKDAVETMAKLLEDLESGRLGPRAADGDLVASLVEREVAVVDYAGWRRIDDHERSLGEPAGRPRVKLTDHGELTERALANAASSG